MIPRRVPATALLVLLAVGARAQQAPNPSFNLVNRSPDPIRELYASPAGVTRWGQDRLGQNYLPPGVSFPVRLPADGNCIYDVRVVYADNREEERRGLNTCTAESVAFSGGGARPGGGNAGGGAGTGAAGRGTGREATLRLVNRGGAEVQEVYATPPGDPNWGSDRLGDDTLAPGSARVIRLPAGGCVFDVRVVYADGQETERRRVDLCAAPEMRVP